MGFVAGLVAGSYAGKLGADAVEDSAVEYSDALQLARRICDEWLLDFSSLVPRPVADVVHLLQRL